MPEAGRRRGVDRETGLPARRGAGRGTFGVGTPSGGRGQSTRPGRVARRVSRCRCAVTVASLAGREPTPRRSNHPPAQCQGSVKSRDAARQASMDLSTSSFAARRAGQAAAITPNTAARITISRSCAGASENLLDALVVERLHHRPGEDHADDETEQRAEQGDDDRLPPHARPQLAAASCRPRAASPSS